MRNRQFLKRLLHSRFYTRKPFIFVNSIPKAGTHFVKEVLLGAGLKFAGHFDNEPKIDLDLSAGERNCFSTGHVSRNVVSGGRCLLLFRSPVDVAVSMVAYIQKRPDHPRHGVFSRMDLGQACHSIFSGTGDLEPLEERFRVFGDWGQRNDASFVDFDDVRKDPQYLIQLCQLGQPVSTERINRYLARWNPTKRKRRLPAELQLKADLQETIEREHRNLWREYENLKSLAQTGSTSTR